MPKLLHKRVGARPRSGEGGAYLAGANGSISNHRSEYLKIIRWKEWSSKIPLFFVCMFYAALSRPPLQIAAIGELAGLTLILCLYAAFGYTINSYSDSEVDRAADKQNKFNEMSEARARTFVGLIVMASVAAALSLYWGRIGVLSLIACAYALAAAYSLPSIRLKECGWLGWLASAIAQRTLPAIIIFAAMQYWDWTALGLCILSTLVGLRYIAVHQIKDEEADHRTGVRTIATVKGTAFVKRAIDNFLVPLEMVTFVITITLMARLYPAAMWVAILHAIWFCLRNAVRPGKNRPEISFYLTREIGEFCYLYLPLTLSVIMAIANPAFWLVTGLTLIWCNRLFRRESAGIWTIGTRVITRVFRTT